MTRWSGRWVAAVVSYLLLIGVLQCLAYLALHPGPKARRVLLVLALGALQVAATTFAERAGDAAFRRNVIARLGGYELVVAALQLKAAAHTGAQRTVLVDPHSDIASADINDAGLARLVLRHSLRDQHLVFASASVPPGRDERGRCREQISMHWFWYLPCCLKR